MEDNELLKNLVIFLAQQNFGSDEERSAFNRRLLYRQSHSGSVADSVYGWLDSLLGFSPPEFQRSQSVMGHYNVPYENNPGSQ